MPEKSSTENVEFFRAADTEPILNESWILGGMDATGRYTYTRTGSSRLTIHRGITYSSDPRGGASSTPCYESQLAKIRFPISLGANAGFETTASTCDHVPILFQFPINNNGHALALIAGGARIDIEAEISGNGALIKRGPGEARIERASVYRGNTRIEQGVLRVTGQGRLPDRSRLDVWAQGTFLMQIGTADAVDGLYGSGTVRISNNNTLVVGNYAGFNSSGNGNFSGSLIGDGKFAKRGDSGTQTLTGQIDLLGPITVEEGALEFSHSANLTRAPDVQIHSTAIVRVQNTGAFGGVVVSGLLEQIGGGETLINGNFTHEQSATLSVDIAGNTPTVGHRVLVVSGVAQLQGRLQLKLDPQYEPNNLDVFDILTASNILGSFVEIDVIGANEETQFEFAIVDGPGGKIGQVTAFVEPDSTQIPMLPNGLAMIAMILVFSIYRVHHHSSFKKQISKT